MDWAELSPDLLHLIVKKLGDITNFIRFRAVCKKWCLAAPTSNPPPMLPWYLEITSSTENKCGYRFYSLHSNKTQKLYIPQAKDKYIRFGSSCQYVQYVNKGITQCSYQHLKLLDPLTGSKIPIPSTGSEVPIPLEYKNIPLRRHYIGPSHCYNPNSILDGTGEIVMMVGGHLMKYTVLVILLLQDGRNGASSLEKHILQKKIVIHEIGKHVTKLLDVTTRDVIQLEQRLGFTYLLEACGEVLGVVQNFRTYYLDVPLDRILFEVYRLEDVGMTPYWVKMNNDIGGRMLFLESNCRTGFCLNARHFHGFKGNCIYFQGFNGSNVLGRFDIEEGTTQLLPVRFKGVWFVPHL